MKSPTEIEKKLTNKKRIVIGSVQRRPAQEEAKSFEQGSGQMDDGHGPFGEEAGRVINAICIGQ